jgi:hypothetical protein
LSFGDKSGHEVARILQTADPHEKRRSGQRLKTLCVMGNRPNDVRAMKGLVLLRKCVRSDLAHVDPASHEGQLALLCSVAWHRRCS